MKVVGPNSLAESGVRRAGGWLVVGQTRGLATDNHHTGPGWCRVPRVVPRTWLPKMGVQDIQLPCNGLGFVL